MYMSSIHVFPCKCNTYYICINGFWHQFIFHFTDTSKFNETQNATNETTECKDLSDSYYIRIFWTAVAELPGTYVQCTL